MKVSLGTNFLNIAMSDEKLKPIITEFMFVKISFSILSSYRDSESFMMSIIKTQSPPAI